MDGNTSDGGPSIFWSGLAWTVTKLFWFHAYYAAMVGTLYVFSFLGEKVAFAGRFLAALITLIWAALYGVCASIVLNLVGLGGLSQWATARFFKYAMMATTGVTFDIIDPQDHLGSVRPGVFIGNHQTELDVLMLGAMWPKYCTVTAKASLKNYPFLGWFMRLSGCIFIDRANRNDARQALAGAATAIREKRMNVYMFPEGTRSYASEPNLLNFKKGAFHLAVQAQVPIVPCVVANYSDVFCISGFSRLRFRSGKIAVKVLDPIPTKGLTVEDVDELTRMTREKMQEVYTSLTAEARGQPIAMPATSNGTTASAQITTSTDTGKETARPRSRKA